MRNVSSTSKLPRVGTTIFTEMSAMAQAHGALNMSQGFPDFQPPQPLQQAVVAAMAEGRNQYAPMTGDARLREWIAEDAEQRSGVRYHPETEVTVGAGASSLIFATVQAIIHPGDDVMVLTPCYDLYEPAVELAGGRLVCVPLQAETHRLDLPAMKAAWTESMRMVIVNVPNNPTGSTWSREDLRGLADLVEGTDALVVSDEVYGPMHHDGREVLSVTHEPRLRERALVFASFGKILHCTGWKIGYVTAPEALTREIRKVHQYDVFSTGAPFQTGIAGDLPHRFFKRAPDNADTLGLAVGGTVHAIQAACAADQGDPTAGHDTFFYCGPGSVQSVFNAGFLFFHLGFGGSSDSDYCYPTG